MKQPAITDELNLKIESRAIYSLGWGQMESDNPSITLVFPWPDVVKNRS